MKSLGAIVVGIDFSKDSESALREAARIAQWDGAKLHAIHVFDTRAYDELIQFPTFQADDAIDSSHRRLDEWVERVLGRHHEAETEFSVGHPLETLLEATENHGADLLVLGAHGTDHGSRKKVGSLAGKCTRKAPCDVLLVRSPQQAPFKKIVVCIDFSENSLKAARHGIHIAQRDLASIEFLHVFQPVSQYIAASPEYVIGAINLTPEHDTRLAAKLQAKLDTLAGSLVEEAGGCEYTAQVVQGFNLRGAIVDHLNAASADLVVLGVRGTSKFRHMLIGTTAEKVVRHAHCSTLAVKPDGFDYRFR